MMRAIKTFHPRAGEVNNLPHPPRQGWNVYRWGRYRETHPARGDVLLPDRANSFGLASFHKRDSNIAPLAGCDSPNAHFYKHCTPGGVRLL